MAAGRQLFDSCEVSYPPWWWCYGDNFDNFCLLKVIFLAGANRIHNAQATDRLNLLHGPLILKGIICTNSLKARVFLGFQFSPISIGRSSLIAVSTRISL